MTLPVICLIAVFFAWAPIAVMFARWGERESDRVDERENVGLDILNPRERSRNFDATEEQLYAFADMLEAEPDEDDPYEDWTYADAAIAPSPLVSLRRTTDDTLQFAVAPGIKVHDHGREKGDITLAFEAYAEHEGHPVQVHGPDETRTVAPVVGQRRVRWAR